MAIKARLFIGQLIFLIGFCFSCSAFSNGAIHVRRVEIIDKQGFEKPLVASTILIPLQWQAYGGINWNVSNTCGFGYNINFQATSPDGFFGINILPMEQWQWNSAGFPSGTGCPTQAIHSIQHYIQSLVQRLRPGARILDFRRRQDIEQEYQFLNHVTPMPMGEMRSWVESGEALIAYSANGIEMRETVVTAVMFNLSRYQAMAGIPGSDYLSAGSFPGFSMRAPNGQLDFKLAEFIRKSAKPQQEWTRRISKHNAKITSINVQGARDRSKIIARTGDEIRKMQSDSWRLYNESSDYLARERSEAIRGVETYDDPYYGGTVQLDNSYEYAYQLNDSTYVLTNDPNFNPFAETGQNGQRLRPTQ